MVEIKESSCFKQYIWDNPSLCNNCFRRVESSGELLKTGEGVVMYGVDAGGEETDGIYRSQTFCPHCGSVGCQSIEDEATRDALLGQLSRIIEWLESQDLDPDEDEMRAIVHERKAETDQQGNDPEILAEAVEEGI